MSILETKTNHYYHIESSKRNDGNEINFRVNPHRFNHVRSFSLKLFQCPYTFYPVNSNNNKIVIRKNGDTQDRTATLTPGEYSLSQFKIELKTQLDALAGPAQTYTITDNVNTHKLTITQNSSSFIYKGTQSSANKLLGFSNLDTLDLIAHTGPNVLDISGTHYIKIYSNTLTRYDSRIRNSDGTGSNLLVVIPLSNYSFGDIIQKDLDLIYDYHPKDEADIDIELRDEDNNMLGGSDMLNGQNFHLWLQFHSYKTNHPNSYNRVNYRRNINVSNNF